MLFLGGEPRVLVGLDEQVDSLVSGQSVEWHHLEALHHTPLACPRQQTRLRLRVLKGRVVHLQVKQMRVLFPIKPPPTHTPPNNLKPTLYSKTTVRAGVTIFFSTKLVGEGGEGCKAKDTEIDNKKLWYPPPTTPHDQEIIKNIAEHRSSPECKELIETDYPLASLITFHSSSANCGNFIL